MYGSVQFADKTESNDNGVVYRGIYLRESIVAQLTKPNQADTLPMPSVLHFLLETTQQTVGELVAFADSIPQSWVEAFFLTLAESIKKPIDPDVKRRKLVILAVLANRLVFEIEQIPKRKSHVI